MFLKFFFFFVCFIFFSVSVFFFFKKTDATQKMFDHMWASNFLEKLIIWEITSIQEKDKQRRIFGSIYFGMDSVIGQKNKKVIDGFFAEWRNSKDKIFSKRI